MNAVRAMKIVKSSAIVLVATEITYEKTDRKKAHGERERRRQNYKNRGREKERPRDRKRETETDEREHFLLWFPQSR